uniref:Uncharacterized protein n=1 Tax=Corvus moneduloides TaxID=1196302 RepID=A0A8C3DF73_CORMO
GPPAFPDSLLIPSPHPQLSLTPPRSSPLPLVTRPWGPSTTLRPPPAGLAPQPVPHTLSPPTAPQARDCKLVGDLECARRHGDRARVANIIFTLEPPVLLIPGRRLAIKSPWPRHPSHSPSPARGTTARLRAVISQVYI